MEKDDNKKNIYYRITLKGLNINLKFGSEYEFDGVDYWFWVVAECFGKTVGKISALFDDLLVYSAFSENGFNSIWTPHVMHMGISSLAIRKLCVSWVCPTRSLVIITSIFLGSSCQKFQGSIFRLILLMQKTIACVTVNGITFQLRLIYLWEQIFEYELWERK